MSLSYVVSRKVAMSALRQLRSAKLLLFLLSLDILFISLHMLRVLLVPDSGDSAAYWRLSVDEDGSVPELFQYLKFMFMISGLTYLLLR